MLRTKTVGKERGRFDPILERHNDGLWTKQWTHGVRGLSDLPRFDPEEHHVDLTDLRGGVAGLGGMHEDVTPHALQSQATRTYGFEMGSASDEDDIDANRSEPRPKVAADTTSTKDCNAHGPLLVMQSSSPHMTSSEITVRWSACYV
jgi:hypothetical protein